MEHCRGFEQNALLASREEMRGFVSILDRKDFIVCPRPRRIGLSSHNSLRPMRCHTIYATESCNSKAGVELLDLILTKEDPVFEPHHASEIASPPPFFSGSPPSRASNPLIQDARFRDEGTKPISAFFGASPSGLPSPLSSAHEGRIRKPFGAKPAAAVRVEGFNILGRESKNADIPAAVRVEGFDILNRDRPNSGIPSTARVEGFDILNRDRRNSSVSAAA
ncbi:uncharacterized protein LOC116204097 [Punica granatum]|uniref:Uncharacterized protein LOC116204097 n=2 Tax=Punica granatum TaxID=22663 RepID=A0A6P8D4N2_PUNGR|nr:uncharacterized protein LOC116204097 [Punica granatum]PKI69928.1 hypothetical protein CRG98_009803 [Punica granatum]